MITHLLDILIKKFHAVWKILLPCKHFVILLFLLLDLYTVFLLADVYILCDILI